MKNILIKSYNIYDKTEEDCIINIENYTYAIYMDDIKLLKINFKQINSENNFIFTKMSAKEFYELVNKNESR